mmetsp:Transcript_34801/g.39442  ORF Transcript_34801/g.39442 Transcript_34801/m.39442 type:complete len:290 (-) Transcript_34801:42-911(-)
MEAVKVVTPGELVSDNQGLISGNGTYCEDQKIYASICGTIEQTNKLLTVTPLKSRYRGETGNVIVGRIISIDNKRWKVDINGCRDGVLQLSAINLPGGIHRKRTTEDELNMRMFFEENDLLSGEIQEVKRDGSIHLHTRSLKYGKLSQGQLLTVHHRLIKPQKHHFVKLDCGVDAILGQNGYIWIYISDATTPNPSSGINVALTADHREKMARVRNCIQCLALNKVMIYRETIDELYGYTLDFKLSAEDILNPMKAISAIELVKAKQEANSKKFVQYDFEEHSSSMDVA